jgi:anti-anti-sigma factor
MQVNATGGIVVATPSVDAHGQLERLDGLTERMAPGDLALIIDLTAVRMLRSPDLAAMVDVAKGCTRRGGMLTLRGCNPDIRKALRMTRLDQLFAVEDAPAA